MLLAVTRLLLWLGVATLAAVAPARPRQPSDRHFVRPNIAAAGGLATQNGTDGVFAAHLGTWRDGRLQTLLGVADADVNLQFFGLGDHADRTEPGVTYAIAARGGVVGASYQVAGQPVWAGLRYAQVTTRVSLGDASFEPGQVPAQDRDLRLGALTPSLKLDTRDNFFTPTRGWCLDLSAPTFREAFGADRDFELLNLNAQYFHPLGSGLYLGVRGAAKDSSAGTPFFLRPFVALRGAQ